VKGEAYICPFCGAPYRELIPAGVVQVKCRYCGGLVLVPPRLGGLVRRCPGHPETLAVGLCNDCSGSYCDRCLYVLRVQDGELYVCSNCLKKRRAMDAMKAFVVGIGFLIGGLLFISSGLHLPDPGATLFGALMILCSLPFMVYHFYTWTTPWKNPTVHMRIDKIAKVEAEKKLPLNVQELYNKMLNTYIGAFGSSASGEMGLEKRIQAYMKKGFERGEAILKLAQDEGYVK